MGNGTILFFSFRSVLGGGGTRRTTKSTCFLCSSTTTILLLLPLILTLCFTPSVGAADDRNDNNHAGSAAVQPALPQESESIELSKNKNNNNNVEGNAAKAANDNNRKSILSEADDTAKHPPIGDANDSHEKKEQRAVGSENPVVSGVDSDDKSKQTDLGFMHAFLATLSMIVVSELGDKTFFIAAIMAMRHSRVTVFAGAMTALALMHVLSALFGTIATLIPRKFTFYLSSGLFAIFGVKMLREGWKMSPDEGQEEYEETQAELKKYEDDQLQARSAVTQDPETGIVRTADSRLKFLVCVSPLFIQAATLNFLAEWGDRSQIAAIVLAARENLLGVILGGLIGHFLCTGLAVIGGRVIAQKLSIRTVTIIGGVVFLLFAVSAFFVQT